MRRSWSWAAELEQRRHRMYIAKHVVATVCPPCWYTHMKPLPHGGYMISVSANEFLGNEAEVCQEIHGLCAFLDCDGSNDASIVLEVDRQCCVWGLETSLDDESMYDFLRLLRGSDEKNVRRLLIMTYSSAGLPVVPPASAASATSAPSAAWEIRFE